MRYRAMIRSIAREYNTTPSEVEKEMELAIQSAKDTPNFKKIFGERVPSVKEFIYTMAGIIKESEG